MESGFLAVIVSLDIEVHSAAGISQHLKPSFRLGSRVTQLNPINATDKTFYRPMFYTLGEQGDKRQVVRDLRHLYQSTAQRYNAA